jgi:hypothetical protein
LPRERETGSGAVTPPTVRAVSDGAGEDDLTPTLPETCRRRGDFQHALVQTEEAIARSAAGDVHDWTRLVASALEQVREAIDEHVEMIRRPGGVYDEIRERAPRLASRIRRLQREHPIMRARALELIAFLDKPGIGERWPLDEARDDIRHLLSMIERHCQSMTDLVWEAYHRDIGGVE